MQTQEKVFYCLNIAFLENTVTLPFASNLFVTEFTRISAAALINFFSKMRRFLESGA